MIWWSIAVACWVLPWVANRILEARIRHYKRQTVKHANETTALIAEGIVLDEMREVIRERGEDQ